MVIGLFFFVCVCVCVFFFVQIHRVVFLILDLTTTFPFAKVDEVHSSRTTCHGGDVEEALSGVGF